MAPWGAHELVYEFMKRNIGHLTPGASVSSVSQLSTSLAKGNSRADSRCRIRELAEPSTKSSVIHTWTSDTRDDPWLGTRGRLWKMSQVSLKANECWSASRYVSEYRRGITS
jgi:outer membrane protein insertion porin family